MNASDPAMKFLVGMSEVETTTLSALTWEPFANTTPDWLISTIWPFAVIFPSICERLPPTTRFSAIAVLFGWRKFTCAAAPTSKLCQLIAARWLVWVMVVSAGACAMLALPATTAPPVGVVPGASWAWPRAGSRAADSAVEQNSAARRLPLPSPFRGILRMAKNPSQ